ncbi:MAG: CHAT domain-containing protein [Verrucomicrobiota bacterium]
MTVEVADSGDFKKRILILAANPKDAERLRLDKEVREIGEGLRRANQREDFELISTWAVRTNDLRRALLDYQPHVVHFSGYGAGESGIALENNLGHTQLVTANALSRLFSLFREQVECVLLNACYSHIQASAIHNCIDIVIGMNQAIGDDAAIQFAIGFYDALGAGRQYRDAYEFGCNAIDLDGIPESFTPVLYHNLNDGMYESSASSTTNKNDKGYSASIKKRAKTTFEIVVEADENKENLDVLLAALKKLSGDSTLKIRKIEKGSIKLTIEGSEDAFFRLQSLFNSGALNQELDLIVKSLRKTPNRSQKEAGSVRGATDEELLQWIEASKSSIRKEKEQALGNLYVYLELDAIKRYKSRYPVLNIASIELSFNEVLSRTLDHALELSVDKNRSPNLPTITDFSILADATGKPYSISLRLRSWLDQAWGLRWSVLSIITKANSKDFDGRPVVASLKQRYASTSSVSLVQSTEDSSQSIEDSSLEEIIWRDRMLSYSVVSALSKVIERPEIREYLSSSHYEKYPHLNAYTTTKYLLENVGGTWSRGTAKSVAALMKEHISTRKMAQNFMVSRHVAKSWQHKYFAFMKNFLMDAYKQGEFNND